MIFARTDHEETQLDAVAIIDIVHWLLVGNDSAVAEARGVPPDGLRNAKRSVKSKIFLQKFFNLYKV